MASAATDLIEISDEENYIAATGDDCVLEYVEEVAAPCSEIQVEGMGDTYVNTRDVAPQYVGSIQDVQIAQPYTRDKNSLPSEVFGIHLDTSAADHQGIMAREVHRPGVLEDSDGPGMEADVEVESDDSDSRTSKYQGGFSDLTNVIQAGASQIGQGRDTITSQIDASLDIQGPASTTTKHETANVNPGSAVILPDSAGRNLVTGMEGIDTLGGARVPVPDPDMNTDPDCLTEKGDETERSDLDFGVTNDYQDEDGDDEGDDDYDAFTSSDSSDSILLQKMNQFKPTRMNLRSRKLVVGGIGKGGPKEKCDSTSDSDRVTRKRKTAPKTPSTSPPGSSPTEEIIFKTPTKKKGRPKKKSKAEQISEALNNLDIDIKNIHVVHKAISGSMPTACLNEDSRETTESEPPETFQSSFRHTKEMRRADTVKRSRTGNEQSVRSKIRKIGQSESNDDSRGDEEYKYEPSEPGDETSDWNGDSAPRLRQPVKKVIRKKKKVPTATLR